MINDAGQCSECGFYNKLCVAERCNYDRRHADRFTVKDSGKRKDFESGMVRDTEAGKMDYLRITEGPMFERWSEHLAKGAEKYKDVAPGVANWTLADGPEELIRFRRSAFRHFVQWLRGDQDEDHAAAVFFNVNGAEYVRDKQPPGLL